MERFFLKDLLVKYNINNNDINSNALKGLVAALKKSKLLYEEKQLLYFDNELFDYLWHLYIDSLLFFDINYNRKSDFTLYFMSLIKATIDDEFINFFALFCPGYTKNGYKDYLGSTTKWKLKELKNISMFFDKKNIKNNVESYYSDVFLENTDSSLNENWQNELIQNRKLFHVEGEKYFPPEKIKNVSDIDIFKGSESIKGYILQKEIDMVNKRTYNSFIKANMNFYIRMGFTEEQIKYRNDRLITMYRLLSNYINSQKSMIFLPMENMYERENIFSENNTCTMYLKLKKY